MGCVVFDATKQQLVADTTGIFDISRASMSLRVRRLFYVGSFAAIAIVGKLPNQLVIRDIFDKLILGIISLENKGNYEDYMDETFIKMTQPYGEGEAEGDIVSYVIMTAKGLYHRTENRVEILNNSDTVTFGPLSSIFDTVHDALGDVDKTYQYMSRYTAFIGTDLIRIDRSMLSDTYSATTKDNLRTLFKA